MTDCEPSCRRRPHAEARYEWNTDESNAYESNAMDRSALLGMTTGAVVMFGFGVLWLLLGLFRGARSPAWLRLSLLFMGIVLGASIATLAVRSSGPSARRNAADRAAGCDQPRDRAALLSDFRCGGSRDLSGRRRAPNHPLPDLHPLWNRPDCRRSLRSTGSLVQITLVLRDRVRGMPQSVSADFHRGRRPFAKSSGISFGLLLWATAAWIAWVGLSALPGS